MSPPWAVTKMQCLAAQFCALRNHICSEPAWQPFHGASIAFAKWASSIHLCIHKSLHINHPNLDGETDMCRGTTEDYRSHNLTMRVETGDNIQAAVDNIGFIDQAGADWCLLSPPAQLIDPTMQGESFA